MLNRALQSVKTIQPPVDPIRRWLTRQVGNTPGFLSLLNGLRFIFIFICLAIHSYLVDIDFAIRTHLQYLLLFYLVYILINYFVAILFSKSFESRTSSVLQLIADILFSLTYYWITGVPDSDVYLTLFIPALLLIRRFQARWTWVWIMIMFILFASWLIFSGAVSLYEPKLLFTWLAPFGYFTMSIAVMYLVMHPSRISWSLETRGNEIVQNIQDLKTGIVVIDKFGKVLNSSNEIEHRHALNIGDSYEYKFCALRQDGITCNNCPVMTTLRTATPHSAKVQYIDRSGNRYPAYVEALPIRKKGKISEVSFTIKNLGDIQSLSYKIQSFKRSLTQIKNDALEDQLHDIEESINTLYKESQSVMEEPTFDSLDPLLQKLVRRLECQGVVVREASFLDGQWGLVLRKAKWTVRTSEEMSCKLLSIDNKDMLVVKAYLSGEEIEENDLHRYGSTKIKSFNPRKHNLRSLLTFPLATESEVVGTVSLYRKPLGGFTEEEKDYARIIVAMITNYLVRVRLIKDLQFNLNNQLKEQQRKIQSRERMLSEIQKCLLGSNPHNIAKSITRLTHRYLNAEVSSLFLKVDNQLIKVASHGVSDSWFSEETYPQGVGITGKVIDVPIGARYGQPRLANHVDIMQETVEIHRDQYSKKLVSGIVKHLIAVPLNGKNETIGVLRVVNALDRAGSLKEGGFTEQDLTLMRVIADIVAIRLEEVQEQERDAQQLAMSRFELDVVRNLASSLDQDRLLELTLEKALEVMKARQCSVIYKTGNGWNYKHAGDRPYEYSQTTDPDPLVIRVLQTGKPKTQSLEKGITLAVPITTGKEVIGILKVINPNEDLFAVIGYQPLERLAYWLAITLNTARKYEEIQGQRLFAETLAETMRSLVVISNRRKALSNVIQKFSETVDFETAVIFLEVGKHLQLIVHYGFPKDMEEELDKLQLDVAGNKPYQYLKQERKYLIIDDLKAMPWLQPVVGIEHINSWLGAPIIGKSGVIGQVSVDSVDTQRFSRQDGERLMEFAASLALVLDQGVSITADNELIQLFYEWESVDLVTLRRLRKELVQKALNALNCDTATIIPYDSDEQILLIEERVALGEKVEYVHNSMPSATGLTQAVFASSTGQIVINDLREHPHIVSSYAQMQGIMATVGISLQLHDKIVGVLFINYYEPHVFSDNEISDFHKFAEAAVLTVNRTSSLIKLERMAVEKARERFYYDIHDVLAHYRFAVIEGAENIVREVKQKGTVDFATAESLKNTTLSFYQDFQSVMQDATNSTLQYGLSRALQELCEQYQKENPNVRIGYTFESGDEEDCTLRVTVENVLYRVAKEVINNVRKHSELQQQNNAYLFVRLTYNNRFAYLTIRDNGVGFDPSRVTKGSGLQFIKRWTSRISAEMTLQAEENVGTKIFVKVPLPTYLV